ncbi:MAG TPA: DmsE family decaheme c-type cytochrome [Azonexus sp.]|nr:DmsE family decaheme c-type cytochrome [Azonexus sp.]
MKAVRQFLALTVCVSALMGGVALAADAPKAAPKDLILKGDAKCTGCHDEADDTKPTMLDLKPSVLAIGKTKHGTVADGRTPTCTDCHGESEKHLNHKGSDKPPKPDRWFARKSNTPIEARNDACLNCHQGGKHTNWQSSLHANRDVACTSCHKVHAAHDKVREKVTQAEVCFTCHKEQRAQVNRQSHHPIIEGKMICTSCHDVHSDNPKALVKSSTNDTCFTCHMEKRGPFVHNHQPVTEDCAICHNPHGTNIGNLLKARPPFLCQECHNHDGHPGQSASLPGAPTTSPGSLGTVGRGCLNCHTNIHGGNSTQNNATAGRFRR